MGVTVVASILTNVMVSVLELSATSLEVPESDTTQVEGIEVSVPQGGLDPGGQDSGGHGPVCIRCLR